MKISLRLLRVARYQGRSGTPDLYFRSIKFVSKKYAKRPKSGTRCLPWHGTIAIKH